MPPIAHSAQLFRADELASVAASVARLSQDTKVLKQLFFQRFDAAGAWQSLSADELAAALWALAQAKKHTADSVAASPIESRALEAAASVCTATAGRLTPGQTCTVLAALARLVPGRKDAVRSLLQRLQQGQPMQPASLVEVLCAVMLLDVWDDHLLETAGQTFVAGPHAGAHLQHISTGQDTLSLSGENIAMVVAAGITSLANTHLRCCTMKAMTNAATRRSPALLPGVVALVACLTVGRLAAQGLGFVPSTPSTSLRTRTAPRVALAASMRDSEGNKVREPKTFDASDASSVAGSVTVEYKKRPFGVLAYAPSTSGKGAMVWNMNENSRYPGDPQGQAWTGGVKQYMAVKSIAGQDVSTWDFWDILDLLDDKILDNSAGIFQSSGSGGMGNKPAELPVAVEYVEFSSMGGAAPAAPAAGSSEQFVDTRDERFKDLPKDATIKEYKIPPAPPSYTSTVVEGLRSAVAAMPDPVGHAGPRYQGKASLNEASIRQMLAQFKMPSCIETVLTGQILPMKDAYQLAIDAYDILVKEKTLGRVSVPVGKKVTVVGDLHGQLFDFDHMLSLAGFPSPDNQFLFNGDFVDRGPWSVEVIFTILAFKVWQPNGVYMNRGNHEAEMANHFYGFFGELEVKYEKRMIDLFAEIFRATPLCHVINDEVFVVHGGIPGPDPRVWWKGMDNQISFDGRQIQISLSEIENSNRFMEPNPDENPLMVDLLWSDPKGKDGYGPSGRMSSGIYLFGPDVSRNFMEFNGLKMTLRSHEVKAQGYRFDHEGAYPLITVFSAPNYVDKAGNMASVAVLTNDGAKMAGPEFVQYSAQPHPDVPSGAYAVGGPLHPESAAAR
ncbi:pph-5 [Symbiodinium sp. CCMP2456]|nr:pph-5 [Symbiodinium sp. CCMP2456]